MTQREYTTTGFSLSQCDAILRTLQSRPGQWVPMPELAQASGAYAVHSRVSELRQRGHVIEHVSERNGRIVKSSYRIVRES